MTHTIPVDVRRVPLAGDSLAADLSRAEQIAKLMDAQFEVGGVKFGLDALIGLVPVAGDVVSAVIGMYPIYLARKHKLGRIVVARMIANLGIDVLAGVVPLAGDALDVFVKANQKNVALLKKAASRLPSRA